MKTKICFKCGEEKSLDDFYKHSQMNDGHLNKCKECNKKDVHNNYFNNRDYYIEYDKKREKQGSRKIDKLKYQTDRRKREPEKYKARNAIYNAVRDGRVERKPCEMCGDKKSQAHHEDYSKPLDVIWLCRSCHVKHHGKVPY